MIEVKVPTLPESVTDAAVVKWYKKSGDMVRIDENLVDIETDKIVLEVVSQATGKLVNIIKDVDAQVVADEVIAIIEPMDFKEQVPENISDNKITIDPSNDTNNAAASNSTANNTNKSDSSSSTISDLDAGPAARRHGLQNNNKFIKSRTESREKISKLRAKVGERLLAATQDTAMLTTFNEVDMDVIIKIRAKYKDIFEKKYGQRLGFMSFFTKAAAIALQEFPKVNAYLDGNEIVYHDYCDIGIAVASPRGLVVPVLRNVENMNFPEIEGSIADFGSKAQTGKLGLDELSGGTFTISNGGVFGSLLSTPILNPPQTAILGMHKIEKRPIVENDAIVIKPMMYLALSYDHRLIDGAESVKFLVTIKKLLEDPSNMLLDI